MRAMAILCVLSSPMGCQLIKRLTNRGQDAGTPAAAPATPTPIPSVDEDAGNIAMPNPNVEPMPSADDGGAVDPDASTPDPNAAPATEDASAEAPSVDAAVEAAPPPPPVIPTVAEPVPGDDAPRRRRGPRNYCKDHPGRVNPSTGQVCPMVGR